MTHFSFTHFFIASVLIVYAASPKEFNFVSPVLSIVYGKNDNKFCLGFDLDRGFYSNSPSINLTLCVKRGEVCNYSMNMRGKESTLKTLNPIWTYFSAVSEMCIHLDQNK